MSVVDLLSRWARPAFVDDKLGALRYRKKPGGWTGLWIMHRPPVRARFHVDGNRDGPDPESKNRMLVVFDEYPGLWDRIKKEAFGQIEGWLEEVRVIDDLDSFLILEGVGCETGAQAICSGYMPGVTPGSDDLCYSFVYGMYHDRTLHEQALAGKRFVSSDCHVLNVLMRNGRFDYCGIEG